MDDNSFWKVLLAILMLIAVAFSQSSSSRFNRTSSLAAAPAPSSSPPSPTRRPTATSRPPPPPAAGGRRGSVKPCIKHPPNFQQLNLPCGGFQKLECLAECKKLGHVKAYCTQKEHFCLCHSGDLYSC